MANINAPIQKKHTINMSLIVLAFFGVLPVTSADGKPPNHTSAGADALASVDPQSCPLYLPGFPWID